MELRSKPLLALVTISLFTLSLHSTARASNPADGYPEGTAATEALIAIGGAQATIALIAKGAEGNTWDQGFQAVYGISWAEGANYLGQILAAEYAVKPIKKS